MALKTNYEINMIVEDFKTQLILVQIKKKSTLQPVFTE